MSLVGHRSFTSGESDAADSIQTGAGAPVVWLQLLFQLKSEAKNRTKQLKHMRFWTIEVIRRFAMGS